MHLLVRPPSITANGWNVQFYGEKRKCVFQEVCTWRWTRLFEVFSVIVVGVLPYTTLLHPFKLLFYADLVGVVISGHKAKNRSKLKIFFAVQRNTDGTKTSFESFVSVLGHSKHWRGPLLPLQVAVLDIIFLQLLTWGRFVLAKGRLGIDPSTEMIELKFYKNSN